MFPRAYLMMYMAAQYVTSIPQGIAGRQDSCVFSPHAHSILSFALKLALGSPPVVHSRISARWFILLFVNVRGVCR